MSSKDIFKSLGVPVREQEDVNKEINESLGNKPQSTEVARAPMTHITGSVKSMAVHMGIIPYNYKDAEFDVQHIKDNVVEQANAMKRKFKVRNFPAYIKTINGILAGLRSGIAPKSSYLIGAPNGFGKTSFVATSLKLMVAQDWRATPYISLSELAELRIENEKRILQGMELKGGAVYRGTDGNDTYDENLRYSDPRDVVKMPEVVTGRFSWSEYMNSEVLFCFFTTIDSKVIESHTLKAILDIRNAKGLPTIALISTSLNPYKMDYNLREYVWDEILAYKEAKHSLDRVYHVSCYKTPNNIIGDNDLGIEI